jgi:hypothetical protein
MDTDNLIKAVLFGITSTIIGIIMYYIFINMTSNNECIECNKKNYTMEISYFFIGFILYYLLKLDIVKEYFFI